MQDNLHNIRRSFDKGSLSKKTVDPNPIQQFRTWFFEAKESEMVEDVNAMTLCTLGLDGIPSGRVVLLKDYDEYGFYFYTNYLSDKGRAIEAYDKVSLSFFWPSLERQIIIKGKASKTSKETSKRYFDSRPLGSRLGAILSKQSQVITNRRVLDTMLEDLEKVYKDKAPELPEYWGGYLVNPNSIEFWQGRPNRLHDRIRYTLEDLDWKIERLSP
jgi:pyridoxamine 5'-phosphate oxidase